jgi:receptor protein-tyrosine kinase
MSLENSNQAPTTISRLVETKGGNSTDNAGSNDRVNGSGAAFAGKEKITIKVVDRLRAMNMLVPGSAIGNEIKDDYRRIKRPLVSNAIGQNRLAIERGNLLLVTSAVPGEGKTYTAVNLALSIANEMDTTVLLVDCDVAKQSVSRLLGLEKIRGLVDVLENDDLSIGDVIVQTDVPTLRVISAGKQHEYVNELLASRRMIDFIDEIGDRYSDRIIIFDSPPMLSAPQTQVLSSLVGQVVFVVEAGKTAQASVEEALGLIPKTTVTGIVLNKNEGLSGDDGYS